MRGEELDTVIATYVRETCAHAQLFNLKLLELIKERGLKQSEVYQNSHLDRRCFSKLRSGKVRPLRSTVLALCVGLRLDVAQARELMGLAGFAFTLERAADVAVLFCLKRGIFDLTSINTALYVLGEKHIGSF